MTSSHPFIDVERIQFSEWVPWLTGREGIRQPIQSLGVYAWAHFQSSPDPNARPYPIIPEELIYVGETKDLNRRPLSGGSHHRLQHYRTTFKDDSELRCLYVSVFHVEPYVSGGGRSRLLRAFTRYLEDKIYWEYVQKFGKRAALDYKTGKAGP
jgi:hypothetical protein